MSISKGDLVACYVTNTKVYEQLLEWGIVVDVNGLGDLQVLTNHGNLSWWPKKRWRLLKKHVDKSI